MAFKDAPLELRGCKEIALAARNCDNPILSRLKNHRPQRCDLVSDAYAQEVVMVILELESTKARKVLAWHRGGYFGNAQRSSGSGAYRIPGRLCFEYAGPVQLRHEVASNLRFST